MCTSPLASPWRGVAGERCVPSIERKRSRNEDWEWFEWRRSASEIGVGVGLADYVTEREAFVPKALEQQDDVG